MIDKEASAARALAESKGEASRLWGSSEMVGRRTVSGALATGNVAGAQEADESSGFAAQVPQLRVTGGEGGSGSWGCDVVADEGSGGQQSGRGGSWERGDVGGDR